MPNQFVLRHEGFRSCVPVYTGDSLFPINRIYEVANVKSVTRFPRSICKAGQFLAFLFSSPFQHQNKMNKDKEALIRGANQLHPHST